MGDGAQIIDLEIGNGLVYILSRQTTNTNWVDMYYFQYGFQYYGSVNSQTVKNFPNCKNFNPTNISVSAKYPGLLFIATISDMMDFYEILVLELVQNEINYLTSVPVTIPQGAETWSFYTSDANLIVLCDGPNGYIQEYSLNDFQFLKSTKQYPLYGYNISTPLTAWFSPSTQLLYVFVDNNTNQYTLFVYRPGVPNIMVLYSAL